MFPATELMGVFRIRLTVAVGVAVGVPVLVAVILLYIVAGDVPVHMCAPVLVFVLVHVLVRLAHRRLLMTIADPGHGCGGHACGRVLRAALVPAAIGVLMRMRVLAAMVMMVVTIAMAVTVLVPAAIGMLMRMRVLAATVAVVMAPFLALPSFSVMPARRAVTASTAERHTYSSKHGWSGGHHRWLMKRGYPLAAQLPRVSSCMCGL